MKRTTLLEKNPRKLQPCTQNGRKVWKTLGLLIHQIAVVTLFTDGIVAHSFTREILADSTLIIWLIEPNISITKILMLKAELLSPFLGI